MKVLPALKNNIHKLMTGVLTAFLAVANPAFAALPTTSAPTRTTTDGNFIELLQNYAYDILILGGLLLATIGFFLVVKNIFAAYTQIPEGKSTWGAVGMHAGGGVLILVLIIFLLTEAAAIL